MNYIARILSFVEHGPRWNSGPTLSDVENGMTSSCHGWSWPDPDVHLRVSDNTTVRIFGYPNQEAIPPEMWVPLPHFGNSGPPLLYLRGDVPAYVNYIMGEDWRSRLRGDYHTNNAHMFHDGEVILRPSTTTSSSQESQEDLEASERAHCLRMRRCGAVAVRSEVDVIFEETGGQKWLDHLFGWPAAGGVWILRSYPMETVRQDYILETTVMDQMSELVAFAREAIRQQSDMGGLCRVLKEAGAQFYSNIEDCTEVKKLRLLDYVSL